MASQSLPVAAQSNAAVGSNQAWGRIHLYEGFRGAIGQVPLKTPPVRKHPVVNFQNPGVS